MSPCAMRNASLLPSCRSLKGVQHMRSVLIACREKVETLTIKEYDVREAKAAIGRLATVSRLIIMSAATALSDRTGRCGLRGERS
jgi:hypothetical protein